MPHFKRSLVLALLLGMFCAAAQAEGVQARVVQRLDFETGNLLQWKVIQALPGRVKIVRRPVRQGRFSARFVVRPGDNPINASGERAEVSALTGEREGIESWWEWSTRFPRGFRPVRGTWNVFTQWHHTGLTCPPPIFFFIDGSTSPARLALRVRGGSLDPVTCQSTFDNTWTLGRLRRGTWYKFRVHVKWSSDPSVGFVQVWVNGRRAVPKQHVATLYAGLGVYVKQGFYRGPDSNTSVVYHDGLRRFRP